MLTTERPLGRALRVILPLLYGCAVITGTTIVGWGSDYGPVVFFGSTFGLAVLIFIINLVWGLITWIKNGEGYWPLIEWFNL